MVRSLQEERPFTALWASSGTRLKPGIKCTRNSIPCREGRTALAWDELLFAMEARGLLWERGLFCLGFFLEDERCLSCKRGFLRGHRSRCWMNGLCHAAESVSPHLLQPLQKSALQGHCNSHFPAKDVGQSAGQELSFPACFVLIETSEKNIFSWRNMVYSWGLTLLVTLGSPHWAIWGGSMSDSSQESLKLLDLHL